ncbi:MAG: transglutaminase-like cysteine peptidase [Rhizobiaceae bacterium]
MTRTSKAILAVTVAYGVLWTGTSLAGQDSQAIMTVTGRTTQPIGHYEYCKKYVRDCSIRSSNTAPVKLSRARWNEVVSINSQVNNLIIPVTDQELYQVEELWTYPQSYGDCEDYVLLKRKLLLEKGWPPSSLLITVVRQPNGDGHAVLTVRTDASDFILDNLNDRVLAWNETRYQFLKRQAAANSGRWEAIDDSRTKYVGSVN